MAEFQAGHYAKAATDLEALVARVEVTPQVEPFFSPSAPLILMPATIPRRSSPSKTTRRNSRKGDTRAAPPLPSPSRICSARISRMRRRRWRRWRTIPTRVNRPCFSRPKLLKRQARPTTRFDAGKTGRASEIRTPGAMRGATALAKLYAEKGNGAKALRTPGDPAKDCPSGQHRRAERDDG